MKTCAFTGHRPKGLGYPESDGRCDALKRLLRLTVRRLIQEQGVTHFISGMAQSLKSFFFLLLFGNIEAALYRDSGAGFSIATGIMKKLIRPNASSKARVLTGLSIILVICAILNLGGITAAIVAVLVYPVALEIFEVCDIPKRYILGILAAGCYTFVQSMPGTNV